MLLLKLPMPPVVPGKLVYILLTAVCVTSGTASLFQHFPFSMWTQLSITLQNTAEPHPAVCHVCSCYFVAVSTCCAHPSCIWRHSWRKRRSHGSSLSVLLCQPDVAEVDLHHQKTWETLTGRQTDMVDHTEGLTVHRCVIASPTSCALIHVMHSAVCPDDECINEYGWHLPGDCARNPLHAGHMLATDDLPKASMCVLLMI